MLDEGHLIKNPKAKMSRAAAELTAESVGFAQHLRKISVLMLNLHLDRRRWILTGTPIVNAAADRTFLSLPHPPPFDLD